MLSAPSSSVCNAVLLAPRAVISQGFYCGFAHPLGFLPPRLGAIFEGKHGIGRKLARHGRRLPRFRIGRLGRRVVRSGIGRAVHLSCALLIPATALPLGLALLYHTKRSRISSAHRDDREGTRWIERMLGVLDSITNVPG
jgi:hypothetical protein